MAEPYSWMTRSRSISLPRVSWGCCRRDAPCPTESLLEVTGPAWGLAELVVDEVNQRTVQGRAVRYADAWTEVAVCDFG